MDILSWRRTPEGESCLQLAVRHRLPTVVDMLCQKGSSTNDTCTDTGNCILWEALSAQQTDCATILVCLPLSKIVNFCPASLIRTIMVDMQFNSNIYIARTRTAISYSCTEYGKNGEQRLIIKTALTWILNRHWYTVSNVGNVMALALQITKINS